MHKKIFIASLFMAFSSLYAQQDSLYKLFSEKPYLIDSLNLTVKDVVISGNEITKDEIILREMKLKPGKKFTQKKFEHDLLRIYNLRLFTKVDILPIPLDLKNVFVNVDVQERWYILPLPQAGIEDGEWAKTWVGMNFKWDNFRGRNESISLYFRFLYNPFIQASYSVPWITDKFRLFTAISAGYSKTRNQSLTAIGRSSGSNTIKADERNYDNYQFNSQITLGKRISGRLAPFVNFGYDYIKVSEYAEGRTVSPKGIDKYMTFGIGITYDSRDIIEFATNGYYMRTQFLRYGHIIDEINFGKFDLESQSFIPVNFTDKYYITIASRIHTALPVGAVIPLYHHEYLGYSEDYVRGWKGTAYEGEDELTMYNEIRIPILKPRYIKAKELPIIKVMPILKKLDLRHGLYFTLFYDVGAVWYKNQNLKKVRFLSGAGMGLNVILPFGYVARADWAFRLTKPVVGEIGLSLSAKF